MQDLTSLAHLEDDGHTLDHLAAYVMIWYEALNRGGGHPPVNNVPGVMDEMEQVIHQLADRKKRLRDEELNSIYFGSELTDEEVRQRLLARRAAKE